jgi:hypothetical protein
MKHPKLFLLFTFYFSLLPFSHALSFQDPIPGSYTCFVSEQDAFDVNARDAGATLDVVTAQTYKLSTATATEEGSIKASELGEDMSDLGQVFKSGSNVIFQPSSSSSPYAALFLSDSENNSYILIQNNNGNHIRCQSQGADIAATFERAANGQATSTLVADERIPQLTPLNATVEGNYQCQYSQDNYETDGTHTPKEFVDMFNIDLFATGEYACDPLQGDSDSYNCTDNGSQNTFQFDGNTFTWLGGDMQTWFGEMTANYGQDTSGTPTLVMTEEGGDVFTGNTTYNILKCTQVGPVKNVPSSVATSEEFQLAPTDVKAPPPPAGAGGLSGLYINYDDNLNYSVTPSMDMSGNITYTPDLSLNAPAFIYFMEDGYVYEGLYPWSFAELDCSRMKTDNTPLCNTYIIQNGTIQFGTDEPQAFKQTEDGLQIGENVNDFWSKQEPLAAETRLGGTWDYVTAGGFGGTGVDTLTLRQDGTFEWQYSGTLSYSTPDSLSDATGVDVYVGGTSTDAKTGTYRIDGYTLELTLENGTVEKVLFVLDSNDDGSLGNLWLGGATRYLKQ